MTGISAEPIILSPTDSRYKPAMEVYKRASERAQFLTLSELESGIEIGTKGMNMRIFPSTETIFTYIGIIDGREIKICHALHTKDLRDEDDFVVGSGEDDIQREEDQFIVHLVTGQGIQLKRKFAFLKSYQPGRDEVTPIVRLESLNYPFVQHSSADLRYRLSKYTKEPRAERVYRMTLENS